MQKWILSKTDKLLVLNEYSFFILHASFGTGPKSQGPA
ncbi:hypothetical protein GGU45_001877 [Niabella hirudinis]